MAGIYVHIPFCKQACYYCDFHFSTSLKKKKDLINALLLEIRLRHSELKDHTIKTIYIGGGTPSLLSSEELNTIFDEIFKHYSVSDTAEITLEANPDDLSKHKIEELASTKINRLSIGIQSFFQEDLVSMNRAHSVHEAQQCLTFAKELFDNITIDLIYGIPNMTVEKWNENLNRAFEFNIPHISSYALTVEPKTALDTFIRRGNYPPIDEELALQHFNHLVERTKQQNYVHYEISNFGKEGYFSKHNSSYWQGQKYIGFGPSAHSFNGQQRSWNISNNTKYIKAMNNNSIPQTIETLTKKERFNESVMIGLRTIWGVSLEEINTNFGEDYLKLLLANSKKFIKSDHLIIDNSVIKTTNKGKFLADGIASELFMI